MVLTEAKALTSGNLAARVLTTGMRSVLQKIAMLLVPPPPLAATATFAGIRSFSTGTVPMEVAIMPGVSVGETANSSMIKDALQWQPASSPAATLADAQALELLEPPLAKRHALEQRRTCLDCT